jgi:hypothetical protein
MYVSCSEFVTDLFQEALCLLLTFLLASTVFLLYSILSSSYFEFNHFLCVFFLLLIGAFCHLIFLGILFHLFIFPDLSYAADFSVFCFSILSQRLFIFPLYCLNGVSLIVCTAILRFHHLKALF